MTTDTFDVDGVEENIVEKEDLDLTDNLDEESPVSEEELVETPAVVEEQVVLAPEPEEEAPSLVPVEDGVIGAGKVKKAKPKAKKEEPKKSGPGTVALFASRNISWNGVGKLVKGYNLVTPDQASKWLTLDTVRLVDPEEVRVNLG